MWKARNKRGGEPVEKKIDFATFFFFHLSAVDANTSLRSSRHITPRAASVTEAVLGAAIEGFGGGKQPTFRSVRLSRTGCLARHAGHHGVVEKAQALPMLQSVGVLRGTGAAWTEARLGGSEEQSSGSDKRRYGGTHLGLRRNASPFAGRCGNRRPQRWLTPHVRAGVNHPVQAKRARGSASRSTARTTKGVRGTGSRRGLARRNVGANLRSSRSGPHSACFFGGKRCVARQPVPSPRGGGRR